MKKKLLILLLVAALLSSVSMTALADQSDEDADGIWCYTPNEGGLQILTLEGFAPQGKLFISATYTGEWTGTFHGKGSPDDPANSNDTGLLVTHMPEGMDPPGVPMLFVGTVSFAEVEVDGKVGGLEMDIAGDILGDSPAMFSGFKGRWIITGGTGELENLRGEGPWWGPGWQGNPEECGVIYYSVEELSFGD